MNNIDKINNKRTQSVPKLFALAIVLISVFTFSSCEQYLDIEKYVYDQTTLDSIFLSKSRTEQYINGAANLLRDESCLTGTDWGGWFHSPSGGASDEAIIPFDFNSTAILTDLVSEGNTRGFNPWPDCYKGIRKANIVLANLHKNQELTEMEMRDFRGRAYFLRAYFYFYLVRVYGPVPILPDVAFDTDVNVADASYERTPYDKCVEKICADFEEAAKFLPTERIESEQFLPTRGAALTFKARMQLYAASPLFNGGTSLFADWKNSEGENFLSQNKDNTKWGKAAASYKRIIDMRKYQLHTVTKFVNDRGTGTLPLPSTVPDAAFPNGAGDIDPYKSYKSLFDGTYQASTNKEYIYYIRRNDSDDRIYFPSILGGNATYSVTLDMANAYKMADGRTFAEASDAEKSWLPVGTASTFAMEYQLSAARAYRDDNREPRYYASIGFNHCVWPCTSFRGNEDLKNKEITYYQNGNATGTQDNNHRNRTGFTARKYIHQEDILHWNSTKKPKVYPIARYAEVLLGYVEAMNEMEGSYTDESGVTVSRDVDQMVEYFNQVRYRAGQPGITAADAQDPENMRQLIKHEWRIEFAFEDRRYWDLRRWLDAPNVYNTAVKGLDVTAKQAQRETYYTERVWSTETFMRRKFTNKMYFYPIDRNVLQRNGKLVQNPEWQ